MIYGDDDAMNYGENETLLWCFRGFLMNFLKHLGWEIKKENDLSPRMAHDFCRLSFRAQI
uniref:Uncharacterized protein n=1 Tax=Arundo donax TaxID=35708 RepID=A0A0A9EYY4_ARUDO